MIEREAQERVRRYAATGRARWRERRAAGPGRGLVLPPTLAAGLPEDSPVIREEIFGPLLAVTRVRDVDEACDVVDSLPVRAHGRPLLAQPGDGRARAPRGCRSATST